MKPLFIFLNKTLVILELSRLCLGSIRDIKFLVFINLIVPRSLDIQTYELAPSHVTLVMRTCNQRLDFIEVEFFRALVKYHSIYFFIIDTEKYLLIIILNYFSTSFQHIALGLGPIIHFLSLLF